MTLHVDIHVIQSVPPSNMNRDETGSPKTATYGGVRRARVSSQAWKRATRRDFDLHLDTSQLGVRTKRAVELLATRIQQRGDDIDELQAQGLAEEVLKAAGLKVKQRRRAVEGEASQTEYLVFFSNIQLDKLAQLALGSAEKINAKEAKAILKSDHSIDVALFGRMVADAADVNVDAACQVAHAISTHAVATEFDYYTAVDDENPDEETGAGMIGTVEFDSATLYRYATINVPALTANLGDGEAAARAVAAFLRSFVLSMPTGKQNTFANGTVPEGVVVMVREGRPINLVGAFEEAVTSDGGYVRVSCEAFVRQAKAMAGAYGDAAWTSVLAADPRSEALTELGQATSFDQLVDAVTEQVRPAAADVS